MLREGRVEGWGRGRLYGRAPWGRVARGWGTTESARTAEAVPRRLERKPLRSPPTPGSRARPKPDRLSRGSQAEAGRNHAGRRRGEHHRPRPDHETTGLRPGVAAAVATADQFVAAGGADDEWANCIMPPPAGCRLPGSRGRGRGAGDAGCSARSLAADPRARSCSWPRRTEARSRCGRRQSPRGRIPGHLSHRERMDRKLQTRRGRRMYKKRSQIIEPVFGQTKTCRGIDRFQRRGLANCQSEWKVICGTHNLLKLWRSGKACWN